MKHSFYVWIWDTKDKSSFEHICEDYHVKILNTNTSIWINDFFTCWVVPDGDVDLRARPLGSLYQIQIVSTDVIDFMVQGKCSLSHGVVFFNWDFGLEYLIELCGLYYTVEPLWGRGFSDLWIDFQSISWKPHETRAASHHAKIVALVNEFRESSMAIRLGISRNDNYQVTSIDLASECRRDLRTMILDNIALLGK